MKGIPYFGKEASQSQAKCQTTLEKMSIRCSPDFLLLYILLLTNLVKNWNIFLYSYVWGWKIQGKCQTTKIRASGFLPLLLCPTLSPILYILLLPDFLRKLKVKTSDIGHQKSTNVEYVMDSLPNFFFTLPQLPSSLILNFWKISELRNFANRFIFFYNFSYKRIDSIEFSILYWAYK